MKVVNIDDALQVKFNNLVRLLRDMPRVLISFSGGVDSTFLLKVAHETLGDRVVAVTADSAVRVRREIEWAKAFTRTFGIQHHIVCSSELTIPEVARNDSRRCYYCKKYLFGELISFARERHIPFVADGSNRDDDLYYRPGKQAIEEWRIRSPLKEASLRKREIRVLSKEYELPTWKEPSQSCLLTRFPYQTSITLEDLNRVATAEDYLRDLGYEQNRIRVSGNDARIEVAPDKVRDLVTGPHAAMMVQRLKQMGFQHISIDLQGYRSGSMDEGMMTDG
ncbi:MAG: ATP-dependent sacrificial sulfur transferase LarE [Candidatus Omnitrophica bacterium]|nr:ATP-dependent sacrificial sulfur transferase LarE [Candidatus Omnitrophota bacterium]